MPKRSPIVSTPHEAGGADTARPRDPLPQALLVIAPRNFRKNAQRLVDHKSRTGQPALLTFIEDVVAASSRGQDAPEAVKRAIAQHVQASNVGYVLLAGDASIFPTRYRAALDTTRPFDGGYVPTDLYYANLYSGHVTAPGPAFRVIHSGQFDTWDASGNLQYNETFWVEPSPNPDKVDGYPDIAVGRVPARTAAEFGIYVDKVIAYEKSVFAGKTRGKHALFGDGGYPNSNGLAESLGSQDQATRSWEYYGLDFAALPPGWNFADANTVGEVARSAWWMTYIGHGQAHGWLGGNVDADAVKNFVTAGNFPIIFSTGCNTGQFGPIPPFDRYRAVNGQTYEFDIPDKGLEVETITENISGRKWRTPVTIPKPSPYDFSSRHSSARYSFHRTVACEWLLSSPHSGAIAYCGDTETHQPSHDLDLAARILGTYSQQARTLGDMWLAGQQSYWQHFVNSTDIHGMPRVFLGMQTLFADPSLRIPPLSKETAIFTALAIDSNGMLNLAWLDLGNSGLWQGPLRIGGPVLRPGAGLAIVRQTPNVVAALAVGGNGALQVAWLDSEHPGWQGPVAFGGNHLLAGAPVSIFQQNSNVFAALTVDANGIMNIAWLDLTGGGWQGPASFGGQQLLAGAPVTPFRQSESSFAALTVAADGTMNVVWLDLNAPGWQGPASFGGNHLSPGAPVAVAEQSPGVFAALSVDRNGYLNVAWLDLANPGWQGPAPFGAPRLPAGSPLAIFRQSDTVIAALAVDQQGYMNVAWLDSTHPGWQGPIPFGGNHLSPGARIEVFAQTPSIFAALTIDRQGLMNVAWLDTGNDDGWQGPSPFGERRFPPGAPITVFRQRDSVISALAVDNEGFLCVAWLDLTHPGWQGPVAFGEARFIPGTAVGEFQQRV